MILWSLYVINACKKNIEYSRNEASKYSVDLGCQYIKHVVLNKIMPPLISFWILVKIQTFGFSTIIFIAVSERFGYSLRS